MLDKLREWDRETFIYLNSLGIEKFDSFWATITEVVTWIPLYILIIALFFIKLKRHQALNRVVTLFIMFIFVTFVTLFVKEWVARLRPNNIEAFESLIRILKSPTDYSFFSGHASNSFAVTTLVYLFLREHYRWIWLLFIWPFLFSLSRIYVGVHYPIDIIVGTLMGISSGLFFYNFFMYLGQRYFGDKSAS